MTEPECRAILWDIGGVIVELASIREGYESFIEGLVAEYDIDSDPDHALERWKTTLGDHFRGREGNEYRLARNGYEKATAALFDGNPPVGWHARLETAIEESIRPEAGVVETLSTLSASEIGLAIVSDIDTPEAHLILETFGVRNHFDHVTTSEAVGYTKPDERMFRHALDAMDAESGETIMIGDRYDHDIAGAAAVGIETVGYGADARGPDADHEIGELPTLLEIVGIDG